MKPKKFKMKKGYVIVTFTFQDLEQFLKICRKSDLHSPLYSKMPKTLLDVIQTRGYDLKAGDLQLRTSPCCQEPHQTEKLCQSSLHPRYVGYVKDFRDTR